MKYKVKCIAISLKGNKIARAGDEIDHTQLPVPENHKQFLVDGYLEHTKESEAAWAAEEKALTASDEVAEKEANTKAKADAKAKAKAKAKAEADAKAKAKAEADAKAKAEAKKNK